MGWLPVRRKHKSEIDPEPTPVQPSAEPNVTGGTPPARGSNAGVGTSLGTPTNVVYTGGGGSTTYSGQVMVIGPNYHPADPDTGHCGHGSISVICSGCEQGHIYAWYACHECLLQVLQNVRADSEHTYHKCGHQVTDLIYQYTPDAPNYYTLKGVNFDSGGQAIP